MIVVGSIFRDSEDYIQRYSDQVEALRYRIAGEAVIVVAVEGDSSDRTYQKLKSDTDFLVTKVEHGGPNFGSVDNTQRWRQLSVPCNAVLCTALTLMQPGDKFLYVESDLCWSPEPVIRLLNDLDDQHHAVAAMSYVRDTANFYDTWGHMRHGRRFDSRPPYYDGHTIDGGELVKIDSAGSCFTVSAEALPFVEFSARDCIRGVGRSLRAAGYDLWLDPKAEVRHP